MKILISHLKYRAPYLSMGQASNSLGIVLGSKDESLVPFYEDYDHEKLAGYVYEYDIKDAYEC